MIDNILSFIPSPVKAYSTLIALAAVLALAGGATWYFISSERAIGAQKAEAQCSAEKDVQHLADLKQAVANAAETQRRLAAQQENIRDLEKQLASATADAATARAAGDSLRQRANFYAQRASSSDSTAAERQQAASALADALQRCTAGYRQLAADADISYARGAKCQADYDALTGVGQPSGPSSAEPNPSQAAP